MAEKIGVKATYEQRVSEPVVQILNCTTYTIIVLRVCVSLHPEQEICRSGCAGFATYVSSMIDRDSHLRTSLQFQDLTFVVLKEPIDNKPHAVYLRRCLEENTKIRVLDHTCFRFSGTSLRQHFRYRSKTVMLYIKKAAVQTPY